MSQKRKFVYTVIDCDKPHVVAPKRLLPDIVTAAGIKQTRTLFTAIKLAESTVTVRHAPKLETVVDARVIAHKINASFSGKAKRADTTTVMW